ncbi:MAG: hypothetical protein MUC81_05890 [Bacteroidia bacterium]|jgi:hypothetical protein|nr:hypothetical protein [Bacteroidia bacterium]
MAFIISFFNSNRKPVAVFVPAILSLLLTLISIYWFGNYSIALFVIIPLFMGLGSAIIYSKNNEVSFKQTMLVGLLTMGLYAVSLVAFAIEGLICIAMAMPIAVWLVVIGSYLGYKINNRYPNQTTISFLILASLAPVADYMEPEAIPEQIAVTTSITINANPDRVWNNLIAFPKMEKPDEFIFKTGIAYPIQSTIVGQGKGAIRYCAFNTGSFVEPITTWDEPRLLAFNVLEQPEPMVELSMWDINAPHLHDYFVSQKGQFKLTQLSGGKTLLEGTTWYYHRIRPAAYWKLWSTYIIHKIHHRVLNHIKNNSETVILP